MAKPVTPMSKPANTTPPSNELPKYTEVAVGTYKNPKTGIWHLIEIPFDPELLQAGQIKTISTGESDRGTCLESFKIRAADTLSVFNYV